MDNVDNEAQLLNNKGGETLTQTRPPKPRQLSRFDQATSVNNFYLTLPTGLDSNFVGAGMSGSRARTPTIQRNSSGGNIGLDQFGRKFAFNRKSVDNLDLETLQRQNQNYDRLTTPTDIGLEIRS